MVNHMLELKTYARTGILARSPAYAATATMPAPSGPTITMAASRTMCRNDETTSPRRAGTPTAQLPTPKRVSTPRATQLRLREVNHQARKPTPMASRQLVAMTTRTGSRRRDRAVGPVVVMG